MINHYLTTENQNLICEKAKTKKDGIYSFRGIKYIVKSGKATHFCSDGKIVQGFGGFNVVVGRYTNNDDAMELLKSTLKDIK